MAELKEGRILLLEDEIREKLLEGAKAAYDAVVMSYGPRGKNVLLEKGFGRPILTRDGVTIVRDVYFTDRAKNMGTQILAEASETTNRVAGDGTTATVALAYHLLENSVKAMAAGKHPMEIRDILEKDSMTILDALDTMAIEVKDSQLKEVATVSAGDPLIGELIADAVLHVGKDGGILTEKAPILEIEREYVDGYYLQSGFTALQSGKKELPEPYVIISSKTISSGPQLIDLLTKVAQIIKLEPGQVPRLLFIGNFEDAAYNSIVANVNQGKIDAIIIKTPPMYGELGKYLLEDLALYCGCLPITEGINLKEIDQRFVGKANKVVSSKTESTVFGDNTSEQVQVRIQELKDQIEEESVPAFSEKLKDRVAKLEGKICLFRIGAPTDTAKEELEFRIEDAINSTRNAYAEGIVPGGGVTLLELSKLDISDIFRDALRSTFRQLLINANVPSEVGLQDALDAPKGHGFNLRKGTELVDLVKEGIIDPVVVPREVVRNATSAIGNAVTVGASLIYIDNKKE